MRREGTVGPTEGSVALTAVAAGAAFFALWQTFHIGEHSEISINIGGCVQRCMLEVRHKATCVAVCVLNPHAF